MRCPLSAIHWPFPSLPANSSMIHPWVMCLPNPMPSAPNAAYLALVHHLYRLSQLDKPAVKIQSTLKPTNFAHAAHSGELQILADNLAKKLPILHHLPRYPQITLSDSLTIESITHWILEIDKLILAHQNSRMNQTALYAQHAQHIEQSILAASYATKYKDFSSQVDFINLIAERAGLDELDTERFTETLKNPYAGSYIRRIQALDILTGVSSETYHEAQQVSIILQRITECSKVVDTREQYWEINGRILSHQLAGNSDPQVEQIEQVQTEPMPQAEATSPQPAPIPPITPITQIHSAKALLAQRLAKLAR